MKKNDKVTIYYFSVFIKFCMSYIVISYSIIHQLTEHKMYYSVMHNNSLDGALDRKVRIKTAKNYTLVLA